MGALVKIESIWIAPAPAAALVSVAQARVVAGRGLEGDRYFGKADKPDAEVTLVEAEALEAVGLAHGASRRNLVTRGVRLNDLAGREFTVGEVRLLGHGLCEPCRHLEKLAGRADLVQALLHRGGLRAQVIAGGTLRAGDAIYGADQ